MPTTRSNANEAPVSSDAQRNEATGEEEKPTDTTTAQANDLQIDDEPRNLKITNVTGDLTADPPNNSIVIHSVNCLGEWGSGVALALKNVLPGAYKVYRDYCRKNSADTLLGFNFLIRPQEGDYDLTPAADGPPTKPRIWVYCLFVSEGYGRRTKTKPGRSKPADIYKHTKKALRGVKDTLLYGQWGEMVNRGGDLETDYGPNTDVVWTCKFNSGSFGIKWETTLKVIQEIFAEDGENGWEGELRVVSHE